MTEQHSSTAVPLEPQCIQSISEERRGEMEVDKCRGKDGYVEKKIGRREEKGRRGERDTCEKLATGTEYS